MKAWAMLQFARILVTALALVSGSVSAQDAGPKKQEFKSKSGTGRVVVVFSGQSGMAAYAGAAQQIADAGFEVVLVDGNDFWIKDTRRAWGMVKDLVAQAQARSPSPADKVGVVGYSLGGAAALTYAARMPESVAAVVVSYPVTSFIKDPADFAARTKVPALMLAGSADTYLDCCAIDTARRLADSAKGATPPMLSLHEYNGVGHGFNLPTAALKDQAAGQDAMQRTIAQLKQALPAR